ncbi:MAG TPA: LysM peptidoglycan-binding domain-containing protein [Opitutaceae bacterium]|jgi:LysM repeat protein|nr:LysM peptidoglycan-binding domain-containing protein [Opitutaceae bacterium]
MKILKILGIAAGVHALALLLIFANPGCSYTKAASTDSPPISSAPDTSASAPSSAIVTAPDSVGIRYSPTRPGTPVASALESQPVSDVTPASTYTIGHGDSLSTIAKKNGLTKAELAAANHLKTSAVLHVGQKLIIPAKSAPASGAAAPVAAATTATPMAEQASVPPGPVTEATKHTVKPGETLGGIARKYGVRQGELAVANNITDPKKIQPGQELVIPAHTSSTSKSKAAAPKATAAAPADQDLDAGLKPASTTDVPVVKIDESSGPAPKNP